MKTTSKRTLEVIIATAMSVSLLPSNLVFAEGTYKSWTEAAENAVQGVDFTVEDGINYKVYTAAGLAYTANIVNNVDTDINITIENDIDLSTAGVIGYGSDVNEENSWIPIGKSGNEYTGTFEGNGNKIYNLYITTSESVYAGLFGYVEDVGCVNKINIASGSIINEANDGYAGGIAGKNDGMITECTNSSSVSGKYAGGIVGKTFKSITSGIEEKITYCVNNGNVIGSNAGGIVGYADEQSIIDNCINNGQILGAGGDNDMVGGIVGNNAGASGYRSIIKNCTNTSNVANSENYVGGIAGSTAYTDIINCVNSGTIDGAYTAGIVGFHTSDSNIKNCVNSGDVIGSFQVGIVCVVFPGANVKNCYYLNGSAGSAVSVNNFGTVEECYPFISSADGTFVIDDGVGNKDLTEKLNEFVIENSDEDYNQWSYEGGALKMGDVVVVEPIPVEDTPLKAEVAVVAENPDSYNKLVDAGIENQVDSYNGVYGGVEYGNTISTSFRTKQPLSVANDSTYGVWVVDLSQGNAYVKTVDKIGTPIISDSDSVINNNGSIYSMNADKEDTYTLYFDKTTIMSGEGDAVFGLVIDGLYAPDATAKFEFSSEVPTEGTELTESNSIFKGENDSYIHDDSVLHPTQAE